MCDTAAVPPGLHRVLQHFSNFGTTAMASSSPAGSSLPRPCSWFCCRGVLPAHSPVACSKYTLNNSYKSESPMRLTSLNVFAAASASGAVAFFLARMFRSSRAPAPTETPTKSNQAHQSLQSQSTPIFTCDAEEAEERMRRGARIRGEPCVLDVCASNAAEYRRGGCDMIIQDFIEAGASEWAANTLRCILVSRGADQAFRCRPLLLIARYSELTSCPKIAVQDQNRTCQLQKGDATPAALV
jgi:hypothetical protein